MYPHERSLVERLKDKPFALLGVNSDSDRGELKKVLEKEKITWRNWWDGGSMQGPIATKWNVSGWPTIYVLDHRGVIRGKQLRDTSLDKLVDELVKEAEAADDTGSVEGIITLKGKPVAEGKLAFHPDKGKPVEVAINKDGKYSAKDVPSGRLRVTIQAEGVPEKYSSPKLTPLQVEVKAGKNTFDLELQ